MYKRQGLRRTLGRQGDPLLDRGLDPDTCIVAQALARCVVEPRDLRLAEPGGDDGELAVVRRDHGIEPADLGTIQHSAKPCLLYTSPSPRDGKKNIKGDGK
ncbi:hypothetical protein FRIG_15685, partial [Frigoribacterium faeni]|uniref:hypothetical protein n=1 Tax=Frigoribacterium faeni TaxID=145483 RepID=UPI001FAD33A5